MSRGLENAPDWLKWTMDFINRIGFPIAVCVYLGYQALNDRPKMIEALTNFNVTLEKMNRSLDENTDALKRLRRVDR